MSELSEFDDIDLEKASPYTSSVLAPDDKARRKHTSADLSGSVFLISGDGRMLKLPIPSQSPRDPLGWSLRKRASAFAAIMLFNIVVLVALEVPSLMYRALSKDYAGKDLSPFDLGSLNSISSLLMGFGAVFWIPISMVIGRRPVMISCALLFVVSMIWASVARNFYSLLGAISVGGFAGGVTVSTALLVVIDLTFIHERPQAIAIVFSGVGAATLILLSLLPLMADLITGWRPFYYIWSVVSVVALVLVFFFVPETYFLRPPVAFNGQILVQSGAERIRIYEDTYMCPSFPANAKPSQGKPIQGKRLKTWLRSLKIFSSTGGDWKSAMAFYPQTLLCLVNPLIFWVVLMNAVNFGGMMSIGLTYPILMSNAPYNLPPYAISLVNLAASAGSLLAWPASGIIIDRITKRLATLNGGVRHAEYLLPGFALPILSGAASVFIYGIVADRKAHFMWIYLAYALNSFSFSSMSVANTLWVTEAFPYWAAPALAVVGGVSYIASFGMSYLVEEWVKVQGYFWVNTEIGIALLLLGFVLVPMAFWGKSVRQYIHGRWGVYEAGALRPQ